MIEGTFRNSTFSHLFSGGNDTFCIFHSLSQRKIYGGRILSDLFHAFEMPVTFGDAVNALALNYDSSTVNSILTEMRERELLVANPNADLDAYAKRATVGANIYKIRHTYFVPVSDCNLRCAYCFVEDSAKGGFPTGRMTKDIARKSLDVFAKLTEEADKISLTFYGGEPLMNAKVVYDSMYYIRELERKGQFKQPVEVTLLTNGTLVDDRTVAVVKETKCNVAVSIDGPKAIHDAARLDTKNRGSFDDAIAGFRAFQLAGINPGVSCTLTRHNIERIEEVVKYIVEELKPPGIGFNILLPRLGTGNPLDVDHAFAARQLITAFKLLREYGVYEDRIMRRVTPFTDCGFHFKDCMGVGGQVVFTPQGKIGPCQAFIGVDKFFPLDVRKLHSRLSTLSSDDIYRNEIFGEWRYRFPLNMKECFDCPAIAVCGGGCPYASHINHGSIWEIDERICHQAKTALEWMIWDTYDHMSKAGKYQDAVR